MAFWKKIGVYLGGAGARTQGVQSGSPSYYSQAAATPVTVDSALSVSACWASTRLIAETVGSLACLMNDVSKEGVRTKNITHPFAILLASKPNRWQTWNEFFETITYQKVLHGNYYVAKQKNTKGDIIALVPLMSEQMTVTLLDDGAVTYTYQDGTDVRVFSAESIWHGKLFGNGIIGLSPLAYARQSLGIAQAAETSVTRIYKNGGKPSGILMFDKVLTPDQRAQVKKNFDGIAEGNDDRLFVLEAGMKYEQVSLSPQDIELLSSRRFQIEDIARFFGVPSILINDMSQASAWGSGIETIIQGWYKLGLRPYLTSYKSSMKANLLTPAERLTMEFDFDIDELLQPSWAERIKSGKEGVQGGLIMPNEWRKEEGMPPAKGGDALLVQQQMVALDQLDKVPRGNANAQPQNISQ